MTPADAAPFASVFGEPVFQLPLDLYIPPDALRVFLEAFEGPLDLLLYLIRKQNINVVDIPMAPVTAQYMEYIDLMETNRLEMASEYLLMAAVLIEIKSRMLLPRPAAVETDEHDPRAELVRRLLEYEQIKLAAFGLDQHAQAGRDFSWISVYIEKSLDVPQIEVGVDDLKAAWLSILSRRNVNRHHRINREELSVREHMSRILRLLRDGRFIEFSDLFLENRIAAVLVVNFLAVLELVKESLVSITQDQPFSPIYVRLSHVAAD